MGKQVEKGKMVKQSRSKKQEFVGNGKVTPVQIAFIVDRYLSDNRYAQTRTAFRSEASDLISKSPVQEAPKSLLSLGAILEEYITLKETKVWVDQERCRLEQENLRVQNLLSGMQGVMNAYNSGGSGVFTPPLPLPPPPVGSAPMSSLAEATVLGPGGYNPMYNTPAMMSTSRPSNNRKHPVDFSTPVMYHNTTKRKQSKCVSDGPAPSKKSRRSTQSKDVNSEENQQKSLITSAAQSSACDNARSNSPVQGCNNVAKCLFNQETPSPPSNSSFPKTPPRASSSQAEKSTSPLENHSTATTSSKETTPQTITSSNRTIISSETIRVSPNKQISYYSIEKNHTLTCSPLKTNSKRSNVKEHVKGRLDFGTSEMPVIPENQTPEGNNSTSESEKEGDILGLDFPNLDALGVDFNLSEFLYNFDLGSDGLDLSSNETLDDSSPDSHSGSPLTSENVETGTRQVTSEYTSTISEYCSEKDTSFVGTDTVAAMRSVTKRIRIVSPVKNTRQFGSGEPVQ